MLPVKPRRFLPTVLVICALFFVIREPAKAATAATTAFNGLMVVADALMTFAGNLG